MRRVWDGTAVALPRQLAARCSPLKASTPTRTVTTRAAVVNTTAGAWPLLSAHHPASSRCAAVPGVSVSATLLLVVVVLVACWWLHSVWTRVVLACA